MCQSHTGRLTGLWFLPKPAFGLNTNNNNNTWKCRTVIEGNTGDVGRRGRRRKQLLDDLNVTRRYWKVKGETLHRIFRRNVFVRGYGLVRQNKWWWWWWYGTMSKTELHKQRNSMHLHGLWRPKLALPGTRIHNQSRKPTSGHNDRISPS